MRGKKYEIYRETEPKHKKDNFVAVLERYKVSNGRRCGGAYT